MLELFEANPFNLLPHLAALIVAYLLALPIGWNREREERSAGLRTFPLVAVASCGFIQAAESIVGDDPLNRGDHRLREGDEGGAPQLRAHPLAGLAPVRSRCWKSAAVHGGRRTLPPSGDIDRPWPP